MSASCYRGLQLIARLKNTFLVCSCFLSALIVVAVFQNTYRDRQRYISAENLNLRYAAVYDASSPTALRHSGGSGGANLFDDNVDSLTVTKKSYESCDETFNVTLEHNLQTIKNYPKGIAANYIRTIVGNRSLPIRNAEFPVIVTAMTRIFYPKSQALFESIHTRLINKSNYFGKIRIIVYDLGLSRRQLKVLRAKCKCKVRRFPFEDFPHHVKTKKLYTWKPIIIQRVLLEFGFVWWVDTSVRFTTANLDNVIAMAKKYSILFRVTQEGPDKYSVAKQTATETFKFLGEDICKFRHLGEVWANTVLVYLDSVSKVIINAWVSCALNKECMAPVSPEIFLVCDSNNELDSRCHRYDQSVLSILVRRIYHAHNSYPFTDLMANVTIIRSNIISYLEKCEPPPVRHCYL